MNMSKIPVKLVAALKTLGLFESEAKVYAALVMFDYAEPKELVEFLDISKPSVYEGLKGLEERGIIMQVNTKPSVYRAVPPDIAVKLLMDTYVKASDEASKFLSLLEKDKIKDKSSEALWSIYGNQNVEYKIEDMIKNAKKDVLCVMPERYLPFLEGAKGRGLKVVAMIITEDKDLGSKIEESFKGEDIKYVIMSGSDMMDKLLRFKINEETLKSKEIQEALTMFNYNNMFIFMVDDSEFLYMPPLNGSTVSAIHTTNKAVILSSKMFFTGPGSMG